VNDLAQIMKDLSALVIDQVPSLVIKRLINYITGWIQRFCWFLNN